MKRRPILNPLFRLSLTLLVLASLGSRANAALTEKNLNQDLAYYQKTAKSKNLNANDRLYILDRLRKKYNDVDVDLSDLYAEIDHWTRAKQKEAKAKSPEETQKPTVPETESASPTELQTAPDPAQAVPESEASEEENSRSQAVLSKAMVSDRDSSTSLLLEGKGLDEYKEIKNPKTQGRVIVLYLYNTQEKLKPLSKNFKVKKGLIKQVQSKSVSANPPTIRVSISLRENKPYRIKKDKDRLLLRVYKDVRFMETDPDLSAETVVPAPTVLSPLDQMEGETEPPFELEGSTSEPAESALDSEPKTILEIEPGDILDIEVSPAKEFSQQSVVKSNGNVDTFIGELKAMGSAKEDLENQLAKTLSEFIKEPKVKITVQKPGKHQIFLAGQVKAPGVYEYEQKVKCFEFISQSGGFLDDANKKNILIYRTVKGRKKTLVFDADEFLNTADPSKDIRLFPGDLIEVPTSSDFVFVMGAVQIQGKYPLEKGMKLMQAIYAAGGFGENKKADTIRLVRTEEGKKSVEEFRVDQILKTPAEKDVSLKAGDMVVVSEKNRERAGVWRRTTPWIAFIGSLALVLGLLL